jgi:hypothetical protein
LPEESTTSRPFPLSAGCRGRTLPTCLTITPGFPEPATIFVSGTVGRGTAVPSHYWNLTDKMAKSWPSTGDKPSDFFTKTGVELFARTAAALAGTAGGGRHARARDLQR